MSNRANDEQLLAIEHSGGVLLSAGAGSGKTFVLKEHLIYLCQNWIQEFKMNPTIEFSSFIKSKLRKVVMMTFTNKAAGELEIRLKNEIREMTEDESTADSTYWNEILKNIDYLNVSTIHGFCLKLIRQGFFPHIDPDQKIVAEADFKKCITDLFEGWLSKSHSQIDSYNVEMVFKNKNKVLEAIFHIFSDATVRTTWTSLVDRKLKVEDTDEVIREIFTVTGLDLIWQEDISLDSYSEFATKKWFKFIEEFRSCWKQFDFSMESVCKLNEYFNEREYKIPVKPSGKTVPISIKNYYENIKNLKDFFKKNGESISEFSLQFEGKVSSWFETLQSIVNYIEKRYQKLDGLTFSDLEYFVALELQGDSTIERITNEYEYFIIDEFQDTSFIQFSIIRKIIQDDFSRLFCVGDPKQAIYGFRGGEIGVFLECQEKMSINLQLKNNYRSTKNIINFNNQMFDFLFKKGIGFKGEEKNPVVVYYQTVPSEDVLSGEVAELCCTLGFRDLVDKISNAEIVLIESLTLFTKLKELKSYQKKSAVLYKRLKPSLILVGLLIKENIGFTAQVKIPFLEDPINGIFFEIIKHVKDSSDKKREYLLYILNAYLSIISGRKSYQITDMDLRNFDRDVKYFGLYMGFSNLMNACRLYNSNYIQNLDFIKQSILSTRSNIDELLILMNSQKSLSYSLDFQYGEDPGDIILMSAHASKGLQFPNVLLGGIYTNDSLIPNKSPVGKLPLSFKWASQLTGKKMFKTPAFLLEELVSKKKEFSESKRLFYVASTRAEDSLFFVKIDLGLNKRIRSQSACWASGLELWQKETGESISEEIIDIQDLYEDNIKKIGKATPPLFHIDDLGIAKQEHKDKYTILPELSVTRLAILAQCPRKFYLESICKISQDEIDQFLPKDPVEINNVNDSGIFKSSSERGSRLHFQISEIIKSSFLSVPSTLEPALSWTVDKLRINVDNFEFISEKQIKFEMFNYMLSGIPDLILIPHANADIPEVWDFKTGAYEEFKVAPYEFQLMSYAYALYAQGSITPDVPTKLVLCFIDEERVVERIVLKADVENYLQKYFLDINDPDKLGLDHCPQCPYKVICQK